MAEPTKPAGPSPDAAKAVPSPKPEGNPALRMMGLPRLRARLPSRNWLIFFTVVGSFSGAVIYDRRQRRKAQQKWCNAVSHLSDQKLPTNVLPGKLTVYLAAPPGDSLRVAREHFQEYVKPLLVAAAVDWDVVEGRKEGDLRANVAARVRNERKHKGEQSITGYEEDVLAEVRSKANVQEEGIGGEIIIGRHTWKEYIRGTHEGWLGPIDEPQVPVIETIESADILPEPVTDESQSHVGEEETKTLDDASPKAESSTEPDKPKEAKTKTPPSPIPPFILPSAYNNASISSCAPQEFSPSILLPQPHLLGFLNTPIRVYRFLTRRYLAEETGRVVSSLLLAITPSVPYEAPSTSSDQSTLSYDGDVEQPSWEQQRLLIIEEQDWHKIARKPNPEEEPNKERPWTEAMVMDTRIGSRMRKRNLIPDPAAVQTPDATRNPGNIETNDGSHVQGNAAEWKGGAARPERVGWGAWIMETLGFENEEPTCKGWEQGEINSESE